MNGYIQIPSYINNLKEIESVNLQMFFDNSQVEAGRISLTYLRGIYIKDKDYFFQVVDELGLRGFQFVTEKKNNLLPNFTYDYKTFLYIEDNGNRFTNIDFTRFGLGGFIQRFNVNSDLFFNKISVEAFNQLNKHINTEELKQTFIDLGFCICFSTEEAEMVKENVIVDSNENNTFSQEEYLKNSISIAELFKENKYNAFRRFCSKKNISSIQSVTEQTLEEFGCMNGVGHARVKAVRERLVEILNSSYDNLTEHFVQKDNYFYSGTVSVETLFAARTYKLFLKYCHDQQLKIVGDITQAHIETFSKLPKIGKKKVQDVLDVLEKYKFTQEKLNDFIFYAGEMYPYIKDMLVTDILNIYGFSIQTEIDYKMKDLEGVRIKDIGLDHIEIIHLSNELQNQLTPLRTAEQLKSVLKDNDYQILEYRLIEQLTLEATAQVYGITRERIRQIERRAIESAFAYLKSNHFITLIKLLTGATDYIFKKDLKYILEQQTDFVLGLLKTKYSPFTYFESLDIFVINSEVEKELNEIEQYIETLPEYFNLHSDTDLVEKLQDLGFGEHAEELAVNFLIQNGFRQYGIYFSKGNLTITTSLEILFKNHIDKPVRLDEDGVRYIVSLADKLLNYQLDDTGRQIEARIRDVDNIILVDRLTFQWFNEADFESELIDEIDDYMAERLDKFSVVNAEEIYDHFKGQIDKNKIKNKIHLYSIIKYYLNDDYNIGQGNTLNIYMKAEERINTEDTLIKVVNSFGGSCTKEEIREVTKWPFYKIELTISKSNKIISWGKNTVILIDTLDLTQSQKQRLLDLSEKCLSKGYSSASIIYNELKFNRDLAVLINEKDMDDHFKLSGLIKALNPSILGHTNFLYKENSEVKSIEELIIHTFKGETTRNEMKDLMEEYGYKDMMISAVFKNIFNEGLFIEISRGELYPSDKLNLTDEDIDEVKKYVDEQMDGKEYLCMSKLKGYRRKLPSIDLIWSPYLIKSILVKDGGYRQITKEYNDYRYDELIIVKAESEIHTFDDLVYFILKEEYEGAWHEIPIYDFLANKSVLRQQVVDVKKVLPYEIKRKSQYITVDELGYVSMKVKS